MKFEASQRKCSACGETGHNARTCKSKIVPFSTGGYWKEKTYDGLEQLGLPLVDGSHVAMISKVIDGEVLKEPNSNVRIPNITWKEEPITMTWGELNEKCKTQNLVSIGESNYSGAYLRGALAYLPKNTVLTLYTGYHYPLKATFEYGGEEWIFFLAPRVENYYAETITRTSYACSACGREHQQERDADECCFEGCFHNWELNKTKDWENGFFTMYVSCRKCGADSYIEGHADENSDSNPTPTFNAESLDMKNAQGSNMDYECQVCGKPADYNFQDATIRWDIINDEFSGSPKVSEYAGQEQNDFYCQEHADEMETSDFFAESLKFKEWADQEMMTHGGRESFQDWLDDEVSSHGNTSLEDWGEHEIASHEARYDSESVLSAKNLGAVAVGSALGLALVGLFTGKNLLTDMTSKLSKASEAKKDCHSCNTNGSVRKNQTQVLSSEYSVGQINPVEVEGQQDIHGAEGVNNPRFAPSPSPAPHRAKSSKWL